MSIEASVSPAAGKDTVFPFGSSGRIENAFHRQHVALDLLPYDADFTGFGLISA